VAHQELPLVSIVTPSLNQGRFIAETIESVLEQDYPRIEHVVVDGGSTDETLDVLRRYEHLRWVSEPDRGQADAVNKGFRMAHGSIFGWLNADDLYLPGAVSTVVNALRETGCGLVHGGWRQIDEEGATIKDVPAVLFDYRRQLEVSNKVAQPGSFFTREAFEAVGGLDVSYRYAMDYELWLKIGKQFEVRHVDRVLGAYRYHPESKTVAESSGFLPETVRASRRHGGRRLSPIYVDWYLPRRRPWVYRAVIAQRLLRAGDIGGLARRVARRVRGGH
jgi:glycosyltransferase involved in cell wall biosynthesis